MLDLISMAVIVLMFLVAIVYAYGCDQLKGRCS
jgi:hypothetical protein